MEPLLKANLNGDITHLFLADNYYFYFTSACHHLYQTASGPEIGSINDTPASLPFFLSLTFAYVHSLDR